MTPLLAGNILVIGGAFMLGATMVVDFFTGRKHRANLAWFAGLMTTVMMVGALCWLGGLLRFLLSIYA